MGRADWAPIYTTFKIGPITTCAKKTSVICRSVSCQLLMCTVVTGSAGHCAGTAEVSLPPSPLPSFVHLNVSCNVAVISKGEVLATFERAINAFSRPTDPDVEEGDQQVRAYMQRLTQAQQQIRSCTRTHVYL